MVKGVFYPMSRIFKCFESRGFSMLPLIKNKDILLFSHDSKLKLFDIVIAYHQKSRKVLCHRIVKFEGKSVVLHGDNSASFFRASAGFEKVPRSGIKGRVFGIIRNKRVIAGNEFKVRSAICLILAGIRVLPFLINKHILSS